MPAGGNHTGAAGTSRALVEGAHESAGVREVILKAHVLGGDVTPSAALQAVEKSERYS